MNVTKFLALKIAEAALELADDAEAVADNTETATTLKITAGRLAATLLVASRNGVIPGFTPGEAGAIKTGVATALAMEAMGDVMCGRLTLDRLLVFDI